MKKIISLIILVCLFLLMMPFVNGGSCCLSTGSEYCVEGDIDVEGCENILPGSCEEYSSCSNRGACIFVEENICEDSFSEIRCQDAGKEFHLNEECADLEGFNNVCCELSFGGYGGFSYMGENECRDRGGNEAEVFSEFECLQSDENLLGCCVHEDESCTFGLQSSCEDGFAQPFLCSTLVDQCNPICEPDTYIDLGPEEFEMSNAVYNYDSCGNIDSFDAIDNCDGITEMASIEDGIWSCKSATCDNVWDNPYTDENHDGILDNDNTFHGRSYRLNGESWCEYQQAKIGPGLDLPGTKHYIHSCEFGKEKVIPTGNRQEICVEQEVDTSVGVMYSANLLTNDPQMCFSCNREDDSEACCESRINLEPAVGCSYVSIKDLTGNDEIGLMVDAGEYDMLVDILEDGEFEVDRGDFGQFLEFLGSISTLGIFNELNPIEVKMGDLKIMYTINDEIVHVTENLLASEFNSSLFRGCQEDVCAITLMDIPEEPGTYDVSIWGEGNACTAEACVPIPFVDDYCNCVNSVSRTERVDLGSFTVRSNEGICVPLVPPTGSEYCNLFNTDSVNPFLNSEGRIDSFVEFNYYFDFPYNTLGYGSECDGTEDCRTSLLRSLDYSDLGVVVGDNFNNLCISLGDCGIYPGLEGDLTDAGFVISDPGVCTVFQENNPICSNVSERLVGVETKKRNNLLEGESVRPESFLPLFFFIPFGFRKKKNRNLILLFILLFILSACSEGIPQGPPPLPTASEFACSPWEASDGWDNCQKCSLKLSEGGFLPDNNLLDIAKNPAYACTPELCTSLGQDCIFVEGLEGPRCERNVANEYTIPRIIFTDSPTYTCDILNPEDCSEENYEFLNNNIGSDRIKAELNIAGKIEPLTPLSIKFKTVSRNTEPVGQPIVTSCRYGVNNRDELDEFPFPETEDTIETDHELRVTNLIANENYEIYIKCLNEIGDGEPQYGEAFVHVSTGDRLDRSSPFIASITPVDGESFAKFGDSTKDITLHVQGQVDHCRWSNENVQFEDMGTVRIIERSTIIAEGDIVGDDGRITPAGTEIEVVNITDEISTIFRCRKDGASDVNNLCTASLEGIGLGENKFWFSCVGRNGLISGIYPGVNGYTIIGTNQLNITNIECIHSLGEDCGMIYDNYFDFSISTVGGAQEGLAGCEWALSEYSFDVFDEPGGIFNNPEFERTHIERNFSAGSGEFTLGFRCEDLAENVAEEEIVFNVERDTIPPRITKVYRSGAELNVETDEATICYYVNSFGTGFINASEFTGIDFEHSASLGNQNFYRIRCADRFDNFRQTDVYVNIL